MRRKFVESTKESTFTCEQRVDIFRLHLQFDKTSYINRNRLLANLFSFVRSFIPNTAKRREKIVTISWKTENVFRRTIKIQKPPTRQSSEFENISSGAVGCTL